MATTITKTNDQVRFVRGTEANYYNNASSFAHDVYICYDTGNIYMYGQNMNVKRHYRQYPVQENKAQVFSTGLDATKSDFFMFRFTFFNYSRKYPSEIILQGYTYQPSSGLQLCSFRAEGIGQAVFDTLKAYVYNGRVYIYFPGGAAQFKTYVAELLDWHPNGEASITSGYWQSVDSIPDDATNTVDVTVNWALYEAGSGLSKNGETINFNPVRKSATDLIAAATASSVTLSDETYLLTTGNTAADTSAYKRKATTLYKYIDGKLPDASTSARGLMTTAQVEDLTSLKTQVEGTLTPALDTIPAGIEAGESTDAVTVQLKGASLIGTATTLAAATTEKAGVMSAGQVTQLQSAINAVPLQISCTYAVMSSNPKSAEATLDAGEEDAWNKIKSAVMDGRVLMLKFIDPDSNPTIYMAKQVYYPSYEISSWEGDHTAKATFDGFSLSITQSSSGTYTHSWS